VAALALLAMGLQYRLVETRLMQAQRALLSADLDGFAALYDQRRIIAVREAIALRADTGADEMLVLMDRQGQVLAGTLARWPEGLEQAGQGFTVDPAQRCSMTALAGWWWRANCRGGFRCWWAGRWRRWMTRWRRCGGGCWGCWRRCWRRRRAPAGWRRVGDGADRAGERAGRPGGSGRSVGAAAGAARADEFGLLEAHVHAMLDRIENLNRATHHLSDTIAHELRTPLNRMLQRLSRLGGDAAEVAALKDEMRGTVRMFDALLDISRAEADQGTGGGLVPVDLSAVAAEVWELYEPLAEDKGLLPVAEIAPGLMVLGDRTLIAQGLANLIDNAIKYCAPGDPQGCSTRTDPTRNLHAPCPFSPVPAFRLRAVEPAAERTFAGRERQPR
jgi:hypothetical protein